LSRTRPTRDGAAVAGGGCGAVGAAGTAFLTTRTALVGASGGSAGAALYTFLQPGLYAYLNHNLIEAVNLGAAGHFEVEGKWNDDLMKQVAPPAPLAID